MDYMLRKWYFDFLSPGMEYAFVYFAYLRFMGRVRRSLTIHAAWPDGRRVSRSIAIASHQEESSEASPLTIRLADGEITVSGETCRILFSQADCSVDLHFAHGEHFTCAPVKIGPPTKSHILWTPVGMKYQVSGNIALGGSLIEVQGVDGYADFLESSYLPPRVPVRRLYWGRLHHGDIDLVYSHCSGAHERDIWSTIYIRTAEGQRGYTQATIPQMPLGDGVGGPAHYEVRGRGQGQQLGVKITHDVPVQQDSFIDQQEIPSRSLRLLLKLLTRNPRSTKYLSRADVTLDGPGRSLSACNVPLITEIALL